MMVQVQKVCYITQKVSLKKCAISFASSTGYLSPTYVNSFYHGEFVQCKINYGLSTVIQGTLGNCMLPVMSPYFSWFFIESFFEGVQVVPRVYEFA